MEIKIIKTKPYPDQRCGTAGLRQKVAVFRQPHYLENFVQAVFDSVPSLSGGSLVLGGDGRFYNREAVQIILRMAVANGVRRVYVGRHGLLSTPAASHLIRLKQAQGGFLLTASHNPGGPEGDFGIKFNLANGGQASEILTETIYTRSKVIHEYRILDAPHIDIDRLGTTDLPGMQVDVLDPVMEYADLMETLFDFSRIRALLRSPDFKFRYDAMHAVTGPYAEEIFLQRLGAPAISLLRTEPLADFGGRHPDPNPHDAAELVAMFRHHDAPHFGAASDGDGDRNMILGRNLVVSPGDSLAVLAANASLIPGYAGGLAGVARSMPTSRAVDAVAQRLGIPSFETPTGWRFFCNLLDAGKITLCGEESFGTGSSHLREKDGLWAVLFWLNLIAARGESVTEILRRHWAEYGRHFFTRHDYFIPDAALARALIKALESSLPGLSRLHNARADNFAYHDPVDGSESSGQGIRLLFDEHSRIVYRLSGTGTAGATLRVYLERFQPDVSRHSTPVRDALHELSGLARKIARIEELTGVSQPNQEPIS